VQIRPIDAIADDPDSARLSEILGLRDPDVFRHVTTRAGTAGQYTNALPAPQASDSRTPLVFGEIPQRPPHFEHRPELLSQLENADLSEVNIFAIIGPRGVGKSQLAAEVARRELKENWQMIAWVSAGSSDRLMKSLHQISVALGLSSEADRVHVPVPKAGYFNPPSPADDRWRVTGIDRARIWRRG
jgi:hypothetical protein